MSKAGCAMVGHGLQRMSRRRFLRKAGLGAVAVGSLPAVAGTLASPGWADENQTHFHFDCQVLGPTTPDGVKHFLAMAGVRQFMGIARSDWRVVGRFGRPGGR